MVGYRDTPSPTNFPAKQFCKSNTPIITVALLKYIPDKRVSINMIYRETAVKGNIISALCTIPNAKLLKQMVYLLLQQDAATLN